MRITWRLLVLLACCVLGTLVWFNYLSDPQGPFSHVLPSNLGYSARQRAAQSLERANRLAFEGGTAKPPGSKYTRTLVVGRTKEADVSWIYDEFPDIEHAVYVVDDPSASPGFEVPRNRGREAMVYLTYIIDHYDNLSDTTLFFHSHRSAWHNNILLDLDTVNTIRRTSDDHVARIGYFNSRCHLDPGCPSWIHLDRPEVDWDMVKKAEEKHITKEVWHALFPSDPAPPALSQPCCAQFSVSRDRIRLNPRSDYVRLRDWLLQTPLDDSISGRVMEYTWQYLFTRNAEWCPRMHSCYCAGYGICFGSEAKLQAWLDKLRRREILDEEIGKAPEDGEDAERLRDEKERVQRELDEERAEAYRRGEDPMNRQIEAGRSEG